VIDDPRIVVVTGLSGSGKSTALNRLEDLGYHSVQNLPAEMLEPWIAWAGDQHPGRPLAVGLDLSGEGSFVLPEWLTDPRCSEGVDLLFLVATEAVLSRRFSETRRRHPWARDQETLTEALANERERLEPLRSVASEPLDTTNMTAADLKAWVTDNFRPGPRGDLGITVVSFAFKRGVPPWVDLCADVRFLPNPFYDPELRHLTGHDAPVREHVLAQPDARRWLDEFAASVTWQHESFRKSGKSYLTIGVGCTGGRHRSVALTNALSIRLEAAGMRVIVRHRETPRPALGE
jgi:UPF0042 nucleotide-binding protein